MRAFRKNALRNRPDKFLVNTVENRKINLLIVENGMKEDY